MRKDMWLKSTKAEGWLVGEHRAVAHGTFAHFGYGFVHSGHGEALGLRLNPVTRGHVQHFGQRQAGCRCCCR